MGTEAVGEVEAFDEAVAERTEALVELVQALVRLDTTSVDLEPGSQHTENEEAELQALVAERLTASGAEVDQFEPDPASLRSHPMMPPWHHWRDRPITVATRRGAGSGRSLIVNGHIDVVGAGSPEAWTTPAFAAARRDGRIYGRGACDMKGGVACALVALELLRELGIELAGDVIVEVVPDEETCAMGTVACIERGYRADAGIVPEPTGLNLWVATRGLLHGSIHVPGRSGHAEMRQPSWTEGGAVNAITAALPVLEALGVLTEEWSVRADKQHPLLSVPEVQPTKINGGTFISNIPESCTVSINATYLPQNVDGDGYGSTPRTEIESAARGAAAADPWLRENPLVFSWATDYPPSEIPTDHPIIDAAQAAGAQMGQKVKVSGIDTTYDGSLLYVLGDTVSPALGPGDLSRAHAPDEWIGVDELVDATRLYGRLLMHWCGIA
jgi:acetylornithine deacetylase